MQSGEKFLHHSNKLHPFGYGPRKVFRVAIFFCFVTLLHDNLIYEDFAVYINVKMILKNKITIRLRQAES